MFDRFDRIFKLISVCLVLWSTLCGSEVTFIITADIHGDMGAFSHLAKVIRQEKEAVKIDLGDFSQGNYAVTEANALPMIDAFNSLGYEILVPGNHETEYSAETLCLWQKKFKGKMLGAQWSMGQFRMLPYTIVERNGIRVGVVALGESGMKKRAGIWKTLNYRDELASLREVIPELQKKGCAAIVLACHISSSNYGILGRIVREVPEIDVIAGAHSHKEHPGGMMNRIFAVQPGAHGSSAVKLVLHFDRNGRYRFAVSEIIRPGKETDAEIDLLNGKLEKQRRQTGGEMLGSFADAEEFGKFGAEAVRRAVNADAGLFVFDHKKFRDPLTSEGLFEILSYGNRIAVVKISRRQAENFLKRYRKNRSGMLCGVSGDWSKKEFSLAVSDYIYFSHLAARQIPAEIHEKFERQTIIEFLKKREYKEKEVEKSASGTKL